MPLTFEDVRAFVDANGASVAAGRARLDSQGRHLAIQQHLWPLARVIANYPRGLPPDKNPTELRE